MTTVRTLPTAPAPRKRFALTDIRAGRLVLPRRILGYGVEGVGKSTFAAGAPRAVFLCPENGTGHLNIQRLPSPESWDEALEILALVEDADAPFETLVVDPINWLEMLCWARVTGGPGAKPDESTADAIQKYGGGFNKGFEAAVGYWRNLVALLERIWKGGKHVVLLGHCHVKAFQDPTGVAYDRYEMQMHHKAAGLLKQWADDVLFMRHEVLKKPENGKVVAIATGARIMHTQWSRAWDAKSRAALPEELPLSWSEYWNAVEAGTNRVDALKKEIGSLIEAIADKDVTKKATAMVADAKDNAERLAEIANALRVKLDEKTRINT
jgi:hypothetical protein